MRRAAIGIGMLALLVTACGAKPQAVDTANSLASPSGSTVVSTTAPSTSRTSVPPATSTPPPSPSAPKPSTGPAVPPGQIDYSQLPDEYPRSLWTQDDGRTVVVMGEEGGCAKLSAQVLAQSATEVRIALVTVAETHRICPLYVRNTPVAVTLDAPLGTRKVVLTTQPGH